MAKFKAWCNYHMFQEQWKAILDNEFMEAYLHGIIINCVDGMMWQFYPRIFIYIADYLEKSVSYDEDG